MIPTEARAKALWEKYRLPEQKRIHVLLVARVAMFFATKFQVDKKLLLAAALLHDIDKAVPPFPGERHPDTAVRILREEGMGEVADLVRTHPLHSILDVKIAPKTREEKLLYLADKMVKYDIVGVDKRFALWNEEHLPLTEQAIIDTCYPKVKELEQEVFGLAQISLDDILKMKEVPV
ncbi:MAG: HD domain-containing protein [Candidatus Gottesmanbacteria bacterium]|nr:HD domain-containing protein [Candidatus Gottesmanbacteria bacterium]